MGQYNAMKKGVAWLCALSMLLTLLPGALPMAAAVEEAPILEMETQAPAVPEGSACTGLPELMTAESTHTKRAATRAYGTASQYTLESEHFIWSTELSQNQSGNGNGVLGTDVLVNNISPTLFNGWMEKLDLAYESYLKLVGQTPVGGQKLIFIPADTSWAHVASGNSTPYIFWNPNVIPGALMEIEASKGEDVCFGIVHELSHLFDIDNHWTFHGEFFANIKMYYMLQANEFKISLGSGLESGLERMQRLSEAEFENFKKDPTGYKILDAGHAEPPLIAFWPMLANGNWDNGWAAFSKMFRSYYDPNYIVEQAFHDPHAQAQAVIHRLSSFYGSDITNLLDADLKAQLGNRYFTLPLVGTPNVVQYGGPKGIIENGSGNLTLTFDRAVTPVKGKKLDVLLWGSSVRYTPAGDTVPYRDSNGAYPFGYIFTGNETITTLTETSYKMDIPFEKITINGELINYNTLAGAFNGGVTDLSERICQVVVEAGAFSYSSGVTPERDLGYPMSRKCFAVPALVSTAPANKEVNVTSTGTIVLNFDQQMSKKVGSVVLNKTTLPGSWSEDGRTYTAEYSNLPTTDTAQNATFNGFQNAYGVVMPMRSLSFTCGATFPDTSVAVDLSSLSTTGGETGWAYDSETQVLTLSDGANVKLIGTAPQGLRIKVAENAKNVRIELAGASIKTATVYHSAIDMSGATVALTLAANTTNDLSASESNSSAIDVANGTLEIDGSGTLTATSGENRAGLGGRNSQITIRNGTITATGGTNGAGIGGSSDNSQGDSNSFRIAISGGHITATGGAGGAGIGGGNGNVAGGTVTISGGTVFANGGTNSAGIGGGSYGEAITTDISGGTITAKGGQNGAGIGGGHRQGKGGTGGTISIRGGDVTASGGENGAGIGGGNSADGGQITITDGTVSASGGYYGGAGIGGGGGGDQGNGGTISISGGTITATNGTGNENSFADIGCGSGKSAGTITINGGNITVDTIGTAPGGMGGTVTVNGGTIVMTTGQTLEGIHIEGGGKVTINGGSIYTNMISPIPTNKDDKSLTFYAVTMDPPPSGSPPAIGTVVTAATIDGVSCDSRQVVGSGTPSGYGIYDVKVDKNNFVSLWLPTPYTTGTDVSLTFGDTIYEGKCSGMVTHLSKRPPPTWLVAPDPASITFPEADSGYPSVAAQTVTVTNTGNQSLDGGLNIFLTGADAANFTLSARSLPGMKPDESATFTVCPKDNLAGRDAPYAASVSIIDNNNLVSSSVPLSFTVNPVSTIDLLAISGVTAPVAGEVPVTKITDTDQYTGTVTWNDNPDTFGYGTVYTATITLTPKKGYTLNGVAANSFTVADATVTHAANSGTIKAQFPSTTAATYTASITPPTHTFPGATHGYGEQAAQTFTITNTGNQTLNLLQAVLTGTGFKISTPLSPTSIAPEETATVSIHPIAGLDVGAYSGTLNLTRDENVAMSAGSTFMFTVNAKGTIPPEAIEIENARITYGTSYTPSADVNTETYGECTFTYTYNDSTTLPTAVGEYNLTVKAESSTHVGTKPFTLTIEQATPTITDNPTVSGTLFVNATLSTLTLSGGTASAAGSFAFKTPDAFYPAAGEQIVPVVFIPTDTANFATAETTLSVTVMRRQVEDVAALTPITDVPYGTEQAALGLPKTVTMTTKDGKTFSAVPVSWSGYNGNTLGAQTLTGTLDLSAISAEVEQPAQAVTASISVTLMAKDLSGFSVTPIPAQTYTGFAIEPKIVFPDVALTLNTDYTVEYSENTAVGTANVTIRGMGNYTGTIPLTFTIGKSDTAMEVAISDDTPTFGDTLTVTISNISAAPQKLRSATAPNTVYLCLEGADAPLAQATVSGDGATLTYPTGDKGLKIGENTLYVTYGGNDNLHELIGGSFPITLSPKPLANDMIQPMDNQTYTGSQITPRPTLTDGLVSLTSADYTVAWGENLNAGTGTVKVTGTGWYTATATAAFTIDPIESNEIPTPSTVRYNDTAIQWVSIADEAAPYRLEDDTPSYVLGTPVDENGLLGDVPALDEYGVLTYQLKAGLTEENRAQTVTIPVTVTELTNVTTLTVTVTITVTDAAVVTVDMSDITLESRPYNGEPLSRSGEAKGTFGEGEPYTGGFDYLYSGRDGTNYPKTETPPTNAGKYTLSVVVTGGGFIGSNTLPFEITMAAQTAPADLTAVRPTTAADTDGKIEGLDASAKYEYKPANAAAYTPFTGGTAIENLTPGIYLVRLAGDDNHTPSADTQVEVLKYLPTVHIVSVTANGLDAAETTTELTITLGDATFTLLPEYITLTGATKGTLSGGGGTYTLAVSDIPSNGATVTLEFNSALCFFTPERVETTVHRIVSAQFPEEQFADAFGMTREALARWHTQAIALTGQSGWSLGLTVPGIDQNSVTLSREGSGDVIIYLRKGGGTVYKTTVSYLLDTVNPVLEHGDITGIPADWATTAEIVLRPSDVTSGVADVSVSLNEAVIPLQTQADGSYTFTATENGTYAVTVTDLAGNTIDRTVIIDKVDAIAPQLSVSPLPESGRWYGETTITATATDNSAGVTLTVTRNGVAIPLNSGAFTAVTTGTYVLTAADVAGSEVTTSFTIYVEPKIDLFVAKVAPLNSSSTSADLLAVQMWYGEQSATVQSRLGKNDGAAIALAKLNSLLTTKALEAAQAVAGAIEQADTIAAIGAAQTAFDALSPGAKALVPAQARVLLVQKNSDAAAGRNMVAVLANATTPGASYERKQAAAEGYDKLTEAQKSLVSKAPGADAGRLSVTADLAAIDGVLSALAAVPQPYTPHAKTQIQGAADGYHALSDARKSAFPRDEKAALDAMCAQLALAIGVENAISALGASPNEQAILTAQGSYNALTADEKLLVANGSALDAAYEEMMAQKQGDEKAVAQFTTQMAAVKSAPGIAGIEALIETFNGLSEAAQELVNTADYKGLLADWNAAKPVIAQFNAINLTDLTPGKRERIHTALNNYAPLIARQQILVYDAVGEKITVLDGAMIGSENAADAINAIPGHGDGSIGTDCSAQGGGHTYERHRAAIEAAKQTYESLSDAARKLVRDEHKTALNSEYTALIDYLDYTHKAVSVKSKVEVSGLTKKVQLPEESENNVKTLVSVVMEDSRPAVMPTPSAVEKAAALSVDVKLVATLYDDAAQGAAPTATEQVQPKENQSVLVKLQIPDGYKNDTLELWHVKENGGRDRIYDFRPVTEADGVYAVFAVSSFSHFVLFAEEASPAPPSGGDSGGGSGGGAVSVEAPALNVGEHGSATLTPEAPLVGTKITVLVTPDPGYAMDAITAIDAKGKAVAVTAGAKGTYTFVQPGQKVTVSVTFKKVVTKLPFADVLMEDWFYDGVQFTYVHGLFYGTDDTTFSPERSMSRAMLVTVLHRMSGNATEESGTSWYSTAMAWAVAQGITDGTNPEGAITREQLAVMLYRYARLQGEHAATGSNLSAYADAGQVSPWALEAMLWANAQQLVTGSTPTTLIPGAEASRAQVATILMRYMQR